MVRDCDCPLPGEGEGTLYTKVQVQVHDKYSLFQHVSHNIRMIQKIQLIVIYEFWLVFKCCGPVEPDLG